MTLIYLLLVLGINILVHEFGHFIFAKKAGIYVHEFSIGMGPRLFKFNRKNDETTYSIRLFPIGGSVQLAGEGTEDDRDIPKDRLLQSKPWLSRFLTIIAGVLFNYLLAIVLFFIIGLFNGTTTNDVIVQYISEDYPAYIAGMREGQKIVKVDNVNIYSNEQFLLELQMRYGDPITFTVKDNNDTKTITVIPKETAEKEYKWGFLALGEYKEGFIASVKYAFVKTWNLTIQMGIIISYLITGKIGLNSLAGPIGMYNVVGEVAKAGFMDVLYLTALIGINVGFINLLPIPAFDGGRLLFLWIEKIKGSPVNPDLENNIHAVGFILLMLLTVLVAFNDIIRLMN
jgi:regulator of sigma E protease